MMRLSQLLILAIIAALLPACSNDSNSKAARVELKKNESGYYRLFVINRNSM